MRQLALLTILLLAVGLACSSSTSAPEPTATLPPVALTQLAMPPEATYVPSCSTEGYEHLPQGDILVAEVEGLELAEFSYEDGILTITSGNQQNSTPLPEGIHYMTFVLVDGDTAIAQADMEVNICNGEFYYRPINITPIPQQDA